MTKSQFTRGCLTGLCLGWCLCLLAAPDQPRTPEQKATSQTALEEFNDLIGGWRGTAQPQRNSTRGAWAETAEWVWDLKTEGNVAIRYVIDKGQALQSARLTYDPEHKTYLLVAMLPDKSERTYRGKLEEKKLVLLSDKDAAGKIHRITVTRLNEKRTLVLLEQRPAEIERFSRVVEIGYTREGTRLAVEGTDGPECVVTGGKGTIQVTHKGQTYWVCCSGCRDAFEEDPEGILREYAEKVAARKAKAK